MRVIRIGERYSISTDEDDIKIEKSVAKYLEFVKSKRNPVHYIV